MTSKTKKITRIGVVAGLYAALTLALGFISYGPIQFRISEVMTLLPLFGKEYILSLTIGCFLANIIGPYGVPDIVLGTLATFISVYLVYLTGKYMKNKKGNLIIASLWPTIVNVNKGLEKFPGVLLFNSHDQEMIQTLANRIIEITPGGIMDRKTTLDEYLENKDIQAKLKEMYAVKNA